MALRAPPQFLLQSRIGPLIVAFVFRVLMVLATNRQLIPGLRITSWFRTRAENEAVDGATFSQHLLGLALDFDYVDDPASSSLLQTLQSALEAGDFGFLDADDEHVHVQLLPQELLLELLST
ncbi:MAG: D-Ala-D-Ala carboxypeptidase family metallohydrolase [Myxococcota bacterium]